MNIIFHRFFQVIVIRYSLDYTGVVNSPESFTPKDLMTYEKAHKSLVPAAYVTFQFIGQNFDTFREFVVGDGGHSSGKTRNRKSSDGQVFINKPLQPNTNYRVFLRAFIEEVKWQTSSFQNANFWDKIQSCFTHITFNHRSASSVPSKFLAEVYVAKDVAYGEGMQRLTLHFLGLIC